MEQNVKAKWNKNDKNTLKMLTAKMKVHLLLKVDIKSSCSSLL